MFGGQELPAPDVDLSSITIKKDNGDESKQNLAQQDSEKNESKKKKMNKQQNNGLPEATVDISSIRPQDAEKPASEK